MSFLDYSLHVAEGAAPGSLVASIQMSADEWHEITKGLRDDDAEDDPPLPLKARIELLLGFALTEWEQTERRRALDPTDDDDCPF